MSSGDGVRLRWSLHQEDVMWKHFRKEQAGMGPTHVRALRSGAVAAGAFAVGAAAMGAVAIGAAAIGKLSIGRSHIRRLGIDELVVGSLRVTHSLETPSGQKP